MFQEATVRACEAQGHAVAGVTVHALVGEVQARAVTIEQRPQRVPRKRLAHVRPAPDVEDRSHETTSYACGDRATLRRDRGAARVPRAASERWGVWGAISGPPISMAGPFRGPPFSKARPRAAPRAR